MSKHVDYYYLIKIYGPRLNWPLHADDHNMTNAKIKATCRTSQFRFDVAFSLHLDKGIIL